MALSHCPYWVPMTSIANAKLAPGAHVIELKLRNACNNGDVNVNGAGMSIKLFHEVVL